MAEVSVDRLRAVVSRALDDESFAERLFSEPEQVARESGLSRDEELVVRQMSREQFEHAKRDAAAATTEELSEEDLAEVAGGTLGRTSSAGTCTNMIIGRSIIGATGGSYASLTSAACDCCAWKGGINTGALVFPS